MYHRHCHKYYVHLSYNYYVYSRALMQLHNEDIDPHKHTLTSNLKLILTSRFPQGMGESPDPDEELKLSFIKCDNALTRS